MHRGCCHDHREDLVDRKRSALRSAVAPDIIVRGYHTQVKATVFSTSFGRSFHRETDILLLCQGSVW